jgi:hypothetical protein
VENAFRILSQKFPICQRTLKSLPENMENVIFATFILHSCLSYMGSSASDQSNLTKIPKQDGSDH